MERHGLCSPNAATITVTDGGESALATGERRQERPAACPRWVFSQRSEESDFEAESICCATESKSNRRRDAEQLRANDAVGCGQNRVYRDGCKGQPITRGKWKRTGCASARGCEDCAGPCGSRSRETSRRDRAVPPGAGHGRIERGWSDDESGPPSG